MRWRLSGGGWYLAPALVTLAEQIDAVWPGSGPTDGTIGDLSHQARRSDHNPNSAGAVTALDVDEVIEDRGELLVSELVESRDRRIKYLIHEGRIWRSYDKPGIPAWTAGPYSGTNAHLSHVHISVSSVRERWEDDRRWRIDLTNGDTMTTIKRGDTGLTVELYQRALVAWHPTLAADLDETDFPIDGAFGPLTQRAVSYYQKTAQIVAPYIDRPDPLGEIGPITIANLARYVTVR